MKLKQKEKQINVQVIYNAFDPSDVKRDVIVWRRNTQLKTYLRGLPKDVEWKIGVNGKPVDAITDAKMRLQPNDTLTLVVVPRGGGAKNILRMVAMVALVVVAFYIAGPAGAAAALGMSVAATAAIIMVVGGFLINALLPMKMPKLKQDNDSNSYGYDGAKNTVKEGVALPVVYGEFRVAGNYVDLFTENVGDDQYLYGRLAISDGEIDSVTLPEISEQPIANYKDVEWGFTQGTATETVNPYFGRSIAQVTKSVKLTSEYVTHTTTDAVDQIQINFQFPRGLVHITQKKGKKQARSATIQAEYKKSTDSVWLPFGVTKWVSVGAGGTTAATNKLRIIAAPTYVGGVLAEDHDFTIEYKKTGDATWTTLTQEVGRSPSTAYEYTNLGQGYAFRREPIAEYSAMPNTKLYEFVVPAGTYQARIVSGGTITYFGYQTVEANVSHTFTDSRLKTIRKSIESAVLENAVYDVRIKKTSAEGDNEYDIDEMWISDIGEIETSQVPLRHIATAWYRIKMNEQLSGVPNVTWLTKGVKVRKYDINGNVTAYEWSANPAWIVLDMLVGTLRGISNLYNIDWPMFVEWAEHCEDNELYFNGVFDTTTSLWDACQDVLKIGHATFTRMGTKLSIAIDRPTAPSMLFGPGNIFKDSFKISYLGMQDRANEFEVSYFDKADRNKQKTIRIVDTDANARGIPPRPVAYSLLGIDNFEQAQKEAWYQLYNNRYLKRTVTFDAPIESIGLGIGDVALVQHDMMNWGTAGRTGISTSNTVIKLDKPVLMESGSDYALLIIHNFLVRSTGTYASAVGDTLTITGLNYTGVTVDNVKRLRQTATNTDVEIIAISVVGTTAYVQFNGVNTFAVGAVEFTDTDVIEEKPVAFDPDETDTVTVTSNFSLVPTEYSNYMFGVVEIVKKPYRLKAISGEGFDRRTLTWIEYNEAIYNEPEHIVPFPPTTLPAYPDHVTELFYSYALRATLDNSVVSGILSWKSAHIRRYGGADIYVALNGSEEYTFVKSVLNVSDTQLDFNIGDDVSIKVVAFNSTGIRANINSAPYLSHALQSGPAQLDPPTNLVLNQISYLALGLIEATWTAPVGSEEDLLRYRVQIQLEDTVEWDDYGLTSETILRIGDLPVGNHTVRVRSEKGLSYSTWIEEEIIVAYGAESLEPRLDDIQDQIDAISDVNEADTTPPAIPTGLTLGSTITIDTDGSQLVRMTAQWNAVTDTDLNHYDVAIREGSGSYIEFQSGPTTPIYTWTLPANTAFTVKVRAVDHSGNASGYSGSVTHTTARDNVAPGVVTGLAATAAFNSIFLSWLNATANDLSHVEIYENTTNNSATATLLTTVNATSAATGGFTRTGLATNVTRYYWAKSVDTSGNKSAFNAGTATATTAYVNTTELAGLISAAQLNVSIGGGNLLKNSGFERYFDYPTYPYPDGYAAYSNVGTPTYTRGTGRRGGYAVQIDWTANTGVKGLYLENYGPVDNRNIWKPNKTYVWSWYAKATGAAVGQTMGTYWNTGPNVITDISNPPLTTDWQRYVFKLQWGASVDTHGFMSILNGTGNGVSSLTIDDMQIEEGDVATAYAPALLPGEITSTEIATGTITTTNIADDAITTPKIAANAVTADEIAANAIIAGKIAAGTIVAGDIAANTITGAKIAANTIAASNIVALTITAAEIAAATITGAKLVAGTITSDRIQAGTITGDRFNTGTSLPGTITVGSTGVSIATVESRAADPAARVNAYTTQINPGMILISGGTSLANWRNGSDLTKIEGGSIAANTITANKITIGSRGLSFQDLVFQTINGNTCTWTAGAIFYTNDAGTQTYAGISSGSCGSPPGGQYYYIYWVKGATTLSFTTDWSVATAPNNAHIATYAGGTNVSQTYGATIIDGTNITTGTITATQIAANTITAAKIAAGTITASLLAATNVITSSAQISDGIITSAKIGDAQITSAKIGNLQVTSAQIDNLTVGTGKITAGAITSIYYTEASNTITFPSVLSGAKTLCQSVTVVKTESSSMLEVVSQLPFFANDAVDGTYAYEIYSGATLIASRSYSILLDGNNDTHIPLAFTAFFTGISAGTYDVNQYFSRTTSNTCSSSGLRHMRVMEVKK